ncbi:predicted protein [Nematostella vectensis]|uniref:Carnosine N-methyltransferase n=1 Tax=Nematostella vectensis TaxID=45351 RepID=A7SNA6_NEMVE|nr:predicted protein [Nematostella vectensis]|eukprot:XP_001626921.1 predicted protein [Nematostella vectensis]
MNGTCIQETEEERLERLHFNKVLHAFIYYRDYSMRKLARIKADFDHLPANHQQMLPDFPNHLQKVSQCIDANNQFLCNIVNGTPGMFENRDDSKVGKVENTRKAVTSFDMDKVYTTLKQFVRDWSEEGANERKACYSPIIDEIQNLFPPSKFNVSEVSVLVPGAGLGRLMFEIARLGYQCQGNEWSLFMLFASHYILNRSEGVASDTIYPYVHQTCNVRSPNDQIRPIKIPDTDPQDLPPSTNFSMAAGNFLEVYNESDTWDCIATCFFIDTAHNVISYIEHIFNLLKPGGYWINLGPLLYHFADMLNEMSIELSYQDIKRIITDQFKFEMIVNTIPSGYIENDLSMLKMTYESVFFVVRKPA